MGDEYECIWFVMYGTVYNLKYKCMKIEVYEKLVGWFPGVIVVPCVIFEYNGLLGVILFLCNESRFLLRLALDKDVHSRYWDNLPAALSKLLSRPDAWIAE